MTEENHGLPDDYIHSGQVGEVWSITKQRSDLLVKHPAQADHPHIALREKYSKPKHNAWQPHN